MKLNTGRMFTFIIPGAQMTFLYQGQQATLRKNHYSIVAHPTRIKEIKKTVLFKKECVNH
jgi:hypothetical protein